MEQRLCRDAQQHGAQASQPRGARQALPSRTRHLVLHGVVHCRVQRMEVCFVAMACQAQFPSPGQLRLYTTLVRRSGKIRPQAGSGISDARPSPPGSQCEQPRSAPRFPQLLCRLTKKKVFRLDASTVYTAGKMAMLTLVTACTLRARQCAVVRIVHQGSTFRRRRGDGRRRLVGRAIPRCPFME